MSCVCIIISVLRVHVQPLSWYACTRVGSLFDPVLVNCAAKSFNPTRTKSGQCLVCLDAFQTNVVAPPVLLAGSALSDR